MSAVIMVLGAGLTLHLIAYVVLIWKLAGDSFSDFIGALCATLSAAMIGGLMWATLVRVGQ